MTSTQAAYPRTAQLQALIQARVDTLLTPALSTPIYISPPVFPFNFTTFGRAWRI